ncbi:MAG: hypothetical protein E7C50_00215 [Clostridium sp.]|uniref:hypothetical protein n=1 Tax=Clostridium sp. TaxID=1506 RepID=UPI0029028B70|nr:hypothetical protein [Clostridium sp.]MDU2674004.1 hypothetical protein [Clostridium sp.]MDU2680282.1 hypothetical protein [Clostridium sp.]
MINETNTKKESYTSKKINRLMDKLEISNENLADIIIKNSTKEIKGLCNLTLDRVNEIIKGSSPSILECILISEALGKGLGYFYYNGYQVT